MKPTFRPVFLTDVEETADYLCTESGNDVAQNFHQALLRTLALIRDFPELGRLRSDIPFEGVRTFFIKGFPDWLVFYQFHKERGELEFLRLRHGMMHLPGLFESEHEAGSKD